MFLNVYQHRAFKPFLIMNWSKYTTTCMVAQTETSVAPLFMLYFCDTKPDTPWNEALTRDQFPKIKAATHTVVQTEASVTINIEAQ
eukprot:1072979-Ditylum_brightwellii.AAC.1